MSPTFHIEKTLPLHVPTIQCEINTVTDGKTEENCYKKNQSF